MPCRPEIILVSPQGLGPSRQEVWRHPNSIELKQIYVVQDLTRYVSGYSIIQHACADRGTKRERTGSLELGPSSEAVGHSSDQKFPDFLYDPKVPLNSVENQSATRGCPAPNRCSHILRLVSLRCVLILSSHLHLSSDWPLPFSRDWRCTLDLCAAIRTDWQLLMNMVKKC